MMNLLQVAVNRRTMTKLFNIDDTIANKISYWLLAGFLVTLIAMIALRPVAVAIELVDRPGGRKTHHGNVPIVGGLAMLLGIIVGFALLPGASAPSGLFAAACALLVVLGLLDDRFELSAAARLVAHGLIISAMAAGSGLVGG